VIVDLPEATIGVGYPQNRLSIKFMKGDLHKPEATIGAGYSQNRLSMKWMREDLHKPEATIGAGYPQNCLSMKWMRGDLHKVSKVGIIHHWIILSVWVRLQANSRGCSNLSSDPLLLLW
jgi:hypothetical protein